MAKPYFLKNMVSQSKNGKTIYFSKNGKTIFSQKYGFSIKKWKKLYISLKMAKPYFLKNMVSQSKNGFHHIYKNIMIYMFFQTYESLVCLNVFFKLMNADVLESKELVLMIFYYT